MSGWIWEGREGGVRRWDGLKEGEWVEMGREGRDAYGDRETYNTITYECVHLILQFEYKCSSNDLTIIKERCTCRRGTQKQTQRNTPVILMSTSNVSRSQSIPEEQVCHGQTPIRGSKRELSLGESPSMLKFTVATRVGYVR